jgi:hypothetical protein
VNGGGGGEVRGDKRRRERESLCKPYGRGWVGCTGDGELLGIELQRGGTHDVCCLVRLTF